MQGISHTEGGPSSGIGPKRLLLFTGLFVLLTGAGIYVVYGAVAEHAFSFDARLLQWRVLVSLAALLLIYFTADGLRLHFTLKALGHRLPFAVMARLVFVNIFFSNITPLASGGGFAQIWFLRQYGVPLGTATTATTVRTLLAMLFIFISAPLLFLALVPRGAVSLGAGGAAYLALFLLAYVAFFMVLMFRRRWLVAFMDLATGLLWRWRFIDRSRHRAWRRGGRRELARFARGFRRYAHGRRSDVALSVLLTAIFLLSLFSFPALLLWALDYDVAWLRSAGFTAVTTFVMYFSPTPGASGIAEGVFGHLFSGAVSAEHLVLVTLAWRFLTIHVGMIAGVFATHFEMTRGGKRTCQGAVESKPSST